MASKDFSALITQTTSEITDDPNVEVVEAKMEFINPESARQETTDGLKNKLKKNFETIDKDKSGVVTVEEMWYVYFFKL